MYISTLSIQLQLARLWNTLPEDIIYFNSLRQFRTSVNLTNQSNLSTYIIIITIAFIVFPEFCNYYNNNNNNS